MTARFPHIFYGWYITGLAFLCLFVTSTTNSFTFSIFLPAMHDDLGWASSTIVAGSSIAAIVSAVTAPWLGRIVDQSGPFLVLVASMIAFGGSLLASALVVEPWQFFVAFGLVGGISRASLQSVLPGSMIANWFVRKRSAAYGVTAMGPPIANLLMTPATSVLVAAHGWRTGWGAMSALAIGLGLLPGLLLTRRRPEDMGLLPDGDTPLSEVEQQTAPRSTIDDNDWTAYEATHSFEFWQVAGGLALIMAAPSISVVFLFSYFTDKGMSTTIAAAAVTVVSVLQVGSRVAFWVPVIIRLGVRRTLLLWGGLLFTSSILLAFAQSDAWAYAATGVLGLAMGGNLVLQLQIWPEYFGRTAIGSIIGIGHLLQGIMSAVVPLALAAQLDATGSYSNLYLSVAVLVFSGLVIQAKVGRPTRPAR